MKISVLCMFLYESAVNKAYYTILYCPSSYPAQASEKVAVDLGLGVVSPGIPVSFTTSIEIQILYFF